MTTGGGRITTKDVTGPLILKNTRESSQKHSIGIAVKKLAIVLVARSRHTEPSQMTTSEVEAENHCRGSVIH